MIRLISESISGIRSSGVVVSMVARRSRQATVVVLHIPYSLHFLPIATSWSSVIFILADRERAAT